MTITTTMLLHCDWCGQPATHQLSYRSRTSHRPASSEACSDHRDLLIPMLAEMGGAIITPAGSMARY
jgi:hypothetical protein